MTPEHIFTTLRDWSGIGLFYPAGPWLIGTGEALSALLLVVFPVIFILIGKRDSVAKLQLFGALIALAIMSGAIIFHIFTPLGIETPIEWNGDQIVKSSPALFYSACVTWVCALFIIMMRRQAVR